MMQTSNLLIGGVIGAVLSIMKVDGAGMFYAMLGLSVAYFILRFFHFGA